MQTTAILFTGVEQVALGTVTLPEPEPGELLLQAVCTGISPGTEKRCLAGKQEGAPPFPYVPGYCFAGRVLQGGAGTKLAPGTPILCSGTSRLEGANRLWGGHLGHAVRAEADVHLIPDGVSFEAASVARLAAIAYHGVRLARPRSHERVAVVGLGPIGLLSARLFLAAGCRVVGIDPLESRRALLPEAAATIDEARALLPTGADIVVDATGAPPVLPQTISLAKDLPWGDHNEEGARVLVQGSYPQDFLLPYNDAFLKEATILFPRDNQTRDVRAVLDLIARQKLVVEDLLSGVYAPTEAPAVYARLLNPNGGLMTAAFAWNNGQHG
jgi:2-desacetyl-2-hydroxyethyl bacteriochlorophyllide A dehydrogenase